MTKDDFDSLREQDKSRNKRIKPFDSSQFPYTFDEAVATNKEILNSRGMGPEFEVDDYVLEPILINVGKLNSIADTKERVIQQASYLLALISFRQPFFDANKTTALFLAIYLLNSNGYDLPMNTKQEKAEIFDMLTDVMNAKKKYDDVEMLLREKIVSL